MPDGIHHNRMKCFSFEVGSLASFLYFLRRDLCDWPIGNSAFFFRRVSFFKNIFRGATTSVSKLKSEVVAKYRDEDAKDLEEGPLISLWIFVILATSEEENCCLGLAPSLIPGKTGNNCLSHIQLFHTGYLGEANECLLVGQTWHIVAELWKMKRWPKVTKITVSALQQARPEMLVFPIIYRYFQRIVK